MHNSAARPRTDTSSVVWSQPDIFAHHLARHNFDVQISPRANESQSWNLNGRRPSDTYLSPNTQPFVHSNMDPLSSDFIKSDHSGNNQNSLVEGGYAPNHASDIIGHQVQRADGSNDPSCFLSSAISDKGSDDIFLVRSLVAEYCILLIQPFSSVLLLMQQTNNVQCEIADINTQQSGDSYMLDGGNHEWLHMPHQSTPSSISIPSYTLATGNSFDQHLLHASQPFDTNGYGLTDSTNIEFDHSATLGQQAEGLIWHDSVSDLSAATMSMSSGLSMEFMPSMFPENGLPSFSRQECQGVPSSMSEMDHGVLHAALHCSQATSGFSSFSSDIYNFDMMDAKHMYGLDTHRPPTTSADAHGTRSTQPPNIIVTDGSMTQYGYSQGILSSSTLATAPIATTDTSGAGTIFPKHTRIVPTPTPASSPVTGLPMDGLNIMPGDPSHDFQRSNSSMGINRRELDRRGIDHGLSGAPSAVPVRATANIMSNSMSIVGNALVCQPELGSAACLGQSAAARTTDSILMLAADDMRPRKQLPGHPLQPPTQLLFTPSPLPSQINERNYTTQHRDTPDKTASSRNKAKGGGSNRSNTISSGRNKAKAIPASKRISSRRASPITASGRQSSPGTPSRTTKARSPPVLRSGAGTSGSRATVVGDDNDAMLKRRPVVLPPPKSTREVQTLQAQRELLLGPADASNANTYAPAHSPVARAPKRVLLKPEQLQPQQQILPSPRPCGPSNHLNSNSDSAFDATHMRTLYPAPSQEAPIRWDFDPSFTSRRPPGPLLAVSGESDAGTGLFRTGVKIPRPPVDPEDRKARDEYLVMCKDMGLTYKEIRQLGNFSEAESTMRGRYRSLTKSKDQRVRNPKWCEKDVSVVWLLFPINTSAPLPLHQQTALYVGLYD